MPNQLTTNQCRCGHAIADHNPTTGVCIAIRPGQERPTCPCVRPAIAEATRA